VDLEFLGSGSLANGIESTKLSQVENSCQGREPPGLPAGDFGAPGRMRPADEQSAFCIPLSFLGLRVGSGSLPEPVMVS
jgi:hypothetical protein